MLSNIPPKSGDIVGLKFYFTPLLVTVCWILSLSNYAKSDFSSLSAPLKLVALSE